MKKDISVFDYIRGEYKVFTVGDIVLFVGKYTGEVQSDFTVKLDDGTVLKSLETQAHKYRKKTA